MTDDDPEMRKYRNKINRRYHNRRGKDRRLSVKTIASPFLTGAFPPIVLAQLTGLIFLCGSLFAAALLMGEFL